MLTFRLIGVLIMIILGCIASQEVLKVFTPIIPILAVLIVGIVIVRHFTRRF